MAYERVKRNIKMDKTQTKMEEILTSVLIKGKELHSELGICFPNYTIDDTYKNDPNSFWTSGFWPGILWYLYYATNDSSYRETAQAIEDRLDNTLREFYTIHHDAGFVWSLSSVANYKLTGSAESKRRALTAASHLAGRFNLAGDRKSVV